MSAFTAQTTTQELPAAGCETLDEIAQDFHDLLMAHCPLCNGFGPTCIVDTMQSALNRADDCEADMTQPVSMFVAQ